MSAYAGDQRAPRMEGIEGMSLRDYFASKALQGLIAAWPTVATEPLRYNVAASAAYNYADAMLAQRKES